MRLKNTDYKYLVAGVFITGVFMEMLDTTVINVALPQLGRHFHAANDSLEWVITGYLLSLAIWIPASGWIGDRIGTKKTFVFAMGAFTLGSAMCGLSQNIDQLILFRVLQGIGGGMMTPVGTAMLFRAFPPEERAKASVFLAIPAMIAPVIGPIFGGWLVDGPGWRWIFYINLPVGIAGILFAVTVLREHTEEAAGSFDLPGFIFSGAGLVLVLYALSHAPSHGWGSTSVVASAAIGLVCFATMVVVELRVAEPMLDLRLLGDRMFRSSSMAMFLAAAGLLGLLFLLPLYLQQLRGFSAFQAGLTTFPQAIGMGIFLQLTSRLYPQGWSAPHDGVRFVRGHAQLRSLPARGPEHEPLVDTRHHVPARCRHVIRAGQRSGCHLRHDYAPQHGSRFVVVQHQSPGSQRFRRRCAWYRSDRAHRVAPRKPRFSRHVAGDGKRDARWLPRRVPGSDDLRTAGLPQRLPDSRRGCQGYDVPRPTGREDGAGCSRRRECQQRGAPVGAANPE